ncbi:uncharacterized protein LOC143767263 [Ranitomeya variabilis]|uniref:uncharacterized protein LOC143767263 n=1 Tax=Ranitomeya variabilis TaxID=490064 RepID=UPI004057B0FF
MTVTSSQVLCAQNSHISSVQPCGWRSVEIPHYWAGAEDINPLSAEPVVPTISDPLSGDLLYKRILLSDPTRMDRDRDKMAERILHLTLEILFRLTGEDYTVVKKTSSDHCQAPVSEGWGRPLSPITGPPPHPLIHEDINDQKILELTYKMIELLTGEVPIRCQDVTVYFSMKEWEYLEGHKDQYKDVMMEVPQPLTSPDEYTSRSVAHVIFSDFSAYDHSITPDTCEELDSATDVSPAFHNKDLSPDPLKQLLSSDPSKIVKQSKNNRRSCEHQTVFTRKKPYSCSECWKYFSDKSYLVKHLRTHTGEKPFSCLECGKCFAAKSYLVKHHKTHTGEKPFSCSECGKGFGEQSYLVTHQKIHTGEKPFSCPECGKCFTVKDSLVTHQRTHTWEKPYSCLECGKCFTDRSNLAFHERGHTGEKPYSCPECEKCFRDKSHLVKHLRILTREEPFSCSECGKKFSEKSNLVKHLKIHTGEKPFSCLECGKCFTLKDHLVKHQRIHTREKPFSCLKCGKCFRVKPHLIKHLRIHTGEKPYSCSECGKCFTSKPNLVKYLKIHTGEKPFLCSECGKCLQINHILLNITKHILGRNHFHV